MPDEDPTVWSAGGMIKHDHPIKFPSADAARVCFGDRARRLSAFSVWRRGARERPVNPVGQTSSDAVVVAGFGGGSDVTQAMLQTNPASSRAIAVTTTALGNEYVNMLEDMVSRQ
jgi:hypothetical protein